jgi:hypothetical protein
MHVTAMLGLSSCMHVIVMRGGLSSGFRSSQVALVVCQMPQLLSVAVDVLIKGKLRHC